MVSKEPAGDVLITALYKWCICKKKSREIFWPSNCCLETSQNLEFRKGRWWKGTNTRPGYKRCRWKSPSQYWGVIPVHLFEFITTLFPQQASSGSRDAYFMGMRCGAKDTTGRRGGNMLSIQRLRLDNELDSRSDLLEWLFKTRFVVPGSTVLGSPALFRARLFQTHLHFPSIPCGTC